ncbi:circularly permutated Ras protein 1-like [Pseudophryne corroboree]|uniref:circularly permutated Ras protein 1-like n=1 Tax=Pseudophryne corroboree TaxID=495146 RepID=UPI0030816D04
MEFGCRYIYVDQSRSSTELCSHPKSVRATEVQTGAAENDLAFYDNASCVEGPKTEAQLNGSNAYYVQRPEASPSLDQNIPPPIPDRKKKPSLCCRPGTVLPQELRHSKIFPEPNAPPDLLQACGSSLEQQKMPPPVPDRKKKPSVLRQSGSAMSTSVTYDYVRSEDVSAPNVKPLSSAMSTSVTYDYVRSEDVSAPNVKPLSSAMSTSVTYDYVLSEDVSAPNVKPLKILPDDHLYVDFPPPELSGLEQSAPHCKVNPIECQAPDVPKDHPGVTLLPIDNDYLEVLPSQPSDLKMLSVPPRPPDRPITPLLAPSADRLPANCNILLLNIGKMVDSYDLETLGLPLLCSRCSAAFSELNHVQENKTWTCVFCSTENPIIEGVRSEITGGGDQLYIRDSQPGNEYASTDDTMLVFCIDISGSMSVTTEVTGDQSHECNTVYKSRMEAMKSGLRETLNFLYSQHPRKRVALVTFSDQVKLYGDGTTEPQILEDSQLLDPDYLKSQGENQPMPHTLEETLHVLEARIECLEESGVTALGPAALASIAMAAKRPGSKVIICTDGKANTDLGNLENIAEEYTYQSSRLYYSNLADLALQHSVMISVVTLEGTDCRLPELGQLADKTGGKVNIVHPLKLASEFQSILEEEIIATDVKLKVYLPHSMHFLYEGHTEPVLERMFGSTTLDTVLSTEFDIHSDKIKEVLRYSQLPIQVHLSFTLPDGRGRYRIISQKRPVTNDSTAALESINLIVLQNHSVQFSARLAMEGRVNEARKVALELRELVDQVMRNEKYEDQGVVYEDWECTMAPVYEDLQVYEQQKTLKGNVEDSITDVPVVKTFSDEMAKMIFHMKRAKNRVLDKLKHQAEQ